MRRILSLLTTLGIACGATLAAQSAAPPPKVPLETRHVTDRLGRTITFYVSHPKASAPILLMIQGSGCTRVLQTRSGSTYSTLFDLLPLAAEGRFTVVAVEKPFAPEHTAGGTATDCGTVFNADFTAERWLVAIRAALDAARRLPWVDDRRTLVLGGSEGAVMAALLSARDARVTDAVVIGGSGTTQAYDFIVHAYQGCFDRVACLADVERTMKAINAAPDSVTDFAWGHPNRRWSSFFRVDPGDELVRSKARIYLAFGTADVNVPTLSEEVAVAKLLAAGRDVTVRRVPDADHSLMSPGRPDFTDLEREYRRALDWFWAGAR